MRPKDAIRCAVFILACLFCGAVTAIAADELPRVVVIATGGTIATIPDQKTGGLVPARTGEELLKAVPQINKVANIKVTQFSNIPSTDMTPKHWLELSKLVNETLADPDITGIVITHGTSTIDEAAFFLDLTVKSNKPVVLTGAMRSPALISSDGPLNLLNAVMQVVSKEATGKGVTVTLNSRISPARDVVKTHNSDAATFHAGDYGHLGYVDIDKVVFYREPLRRQNLPLPSKLSRVDVISIFSGTDGSYVKFAVDSGAEGIIIEAFGAGGVNEPTADSIEYALKKGIPVVISTREEGRVVPIYGGRAGALTLKEHGCSFSNGLSPMKARILLMLVLPITKDPKQIQSYFDK